MKADKKGTVLTVLDIVKKWSTLADRRDPV